MDYRPCPRSDVWLPARVESIWDGGAGLRLRFTIGVTHVSHDISLRNPAHTLRLAAAGEQSVVVLLSMA